MSKKVSDILPKTEILAQLAEEASELAQAALKLRLNECLMSENQKVCRATGRPAWTFSAGGWKMTTSVVS